MRQLTFPDDNITIELSSVQLGENKNRGGGTICYRLAGELDTDWKKIECTTSNNVLKVLTELREFNSYEEFLELQNTPV